jgi:hypothetical protein
MGYQGEIEVPFEQRLAFFSLIVRHVAPYKARIAFWWVAESSVPVWPLATKVIGPESPFPESGSILAGSGRLLRITPHNAEAFLSLFKPDMLRDLIHVEVESRGRIQFAAYDFFEHVLFSNDIDTSLLETARAQGLIREYYLY